MTLLQQILRKDLTASTGGSGGAALLVIGSEVAEVPQLFESGVAYVEEPNPLLVLARSCPVPDSYGTYELDPSERDRGDDGPEDFGIGFDSGFDEGSGTDF